MKKTVRSITIQIQKNFSRKGQPVTTDIKVDVATDIPGYESVVETHSNLVDTDAIIAEAEAALPAALGHDGAFEISIAEEPES
jgi:DnaJ-class molecular chaperone|tara:strand:+ start:1485 stop:1733 length:249 start_codon:yes stop_codon:yes gene_type:complete